MRWIIWRSKPAETAFRSEPVNSSARLRTVIEPCTCDQPARAPAFQVCAMILVAAGDWPLRISSEVVARVDLALWS